MKRQRAATARRGDGDRQLDYRHVVQDAHGFPRSFPPVESMPRTRRARSAPDAQTSDAEIEAVVVLQEVLRVRRPAELGFVAGEGLVDEARLVREALRPGVDPVHDGL